MARLRGRPLRGEGSGNESASIGSKIVTPSVKVTLSCGNVRAVQRIRVAKFKSSQPTKRWAGDWYDCIRPRGNNPRPLCALRLTGVSFRTESLPVIERMVEFDTISYQARSASGVKVTLRSCLQSSAVAIPAQFRTAWKVTGRLSFSAR